MAVSSRVYFSNRDYDCLKVGLQETISHFLCEKLLVTMLLFCLSMNQLSGSSVKLHVHSKNISRKRESLLTPRQNHSGDA